MSVRNLYLNWLLMSEYRIDSFSHDQFIGKRSGYYNNKASPDKKAKRKRYQVSRRKNRSK